ncbi:MAG: hypothetical protein N7Q72_04890, partial [Spiroplasma sp. Tabriz.8]|nr:hypothetical protein [Spiroplasma sp. Tabriz.8]
IFILYIYIYIYIEREREREGNNSCNFIKWVCCNVGQLFIYLFIYLFFIRVGYLCVSTPQKH